MKKTLALFLLVSGFVGLEGMCGNTGCCSSCCTTSCCGSCCGTFDEEFALLSPEELQQLKVQLLRELEICRNIEVMKELQARIAECKEAIAQGKDASVK